MKRSELKKMIKPIVKEEEISCPRFSFFNPLHIVLSPQHPIGRSPSAVGLGVSPAVEKITSHAALAAGVGGGFRGSRAVVDYPKFVDVVAADDDLVET